MTKTTGTERARGCIMFIVSRNFWINLGLIAAFVLACFFVTTVWLKNYTRHDQRLELPDYLGVNYATALEDAEAKSFKLVILDSIHVVGKEGNLIIQQNPPGGSMVKEDRTIYLTTTKQSADEIPVSLLPQLYGKNYLRKKRELYQSFALQCEVVEERFDPGEPGHILAVRYKGETIISSEGRKNSNTIEKGGALQFVVSKNTGGELEIPDLMCLTYAEARFLVLTSGLKLGEIVTDGNIEVLDSAWVSGQVPDPGEGTIEMGKVVRLSLSADKPLICN